ncbi:MAG: DNA polymerase IV, partial [Azonexus sp.]|nr:DNA polymerase IV [Azonexus sp.]
LSCSIGVTPNKLLSKIASDLEKPNGLTILSLDDVPTRIWPLAAKKVNGIGPKASERLERHGIRTIGELAATPQEFLIRKFGRSTGLWMHRIAHGIDDRPVVTESEPKSISRETTFERDLHVRQDKPELSEKFTSLCLRVGDDLKRKGYACRTIGIKIRYADFSVVTRDVTLPVAISDGAEIRKSAGLCLKRVPLEQRIRLLGIRAGGLVDLAGEQIASKAVQAELPWQEP